MPASLPGGFLALLLTLAAFTPRCEGAAPSRSVVYKHVGKLELKLDIFEPPGMKPGMTYPAIVFFFGGGWVTGIRSQFYPQCADLASRGMIAMSADYRTYGKNGTSPPECVMDAKSCVRWIRNHAAELQIDPARLAAGGGSAGGHLAAATAMLPGYNEAGEDATLSCRPDALVLFNPVLDNGPGGYGYDRVKDYYAQFSPMQNLRAGLPPTLLMLGTKDALVPVKTLRLFQAKSTKLGNRCDLILYPDGEHGFFNKPPFYEKTLQDVDTFLVTLGFLSPKK